MLTPLHLTHTHTHTHTHYHKDHYNHSIVFECELVFLRMLNLEISLTDPCTLKWRITFASTLLMTYNIWRGSHIVVVILIILVMKHQRPHLFTSWLYICMYVCTHTQTHYHKDHYNHLTVIHYWFWMRICLFMDGQPRNKLDPPLHT